METIKTRSVLNIAKICLIFDTLLFVLGLLVETLYSLFIGVLEAALLGLLPAGL